MFKLIFTVILIVGFGSPLLAQKGNPQSVLITVRIGSDLPPGVEAAVFRRSVSPMNLVLIADDHLSAEVVSRAVTSLLFEEAQDPEGKTRSNSRMIVAKGLTVKTFPWAGGVATRLKGGSRDVSRSVTVSVEVPRIKKNKL